MALHRRPDGTAAVLSRGLGGECPPTERRRRPRHFIEKRVPLALGKASVALGSGEGHGQPVAGLGGPQMRAVAGEPRRRLRRHPASSCSKLIRLILVVEKRRLKFSVLITSVSVRSFRFDFPVSIHYVVQQHGLACQTTSCSPVLRLLD